MAACLAVPVGARLALGNGRFPYGRTYAFCDQRFAAARGIAAAWPGRFAPIAVHADVTPLWTGFLGRDIQRYPLQLKGVTTESFLFCLRILAQERSRFEYECSRIDRNLLSWSMNTIPIALLEQLHG